MKGELEIGVVTRKLLLSRGSVEALRKLDRYDHIVFTSKNAKTFFMEEVRRLHISSGRSRIIQVGPRNDLLKFDFKGKRILFPRSALAPHDIVRKLRAKKAIVRVIPLYTTSGKPLSGAQRKQLLNGTIRQLYFKSPSGIQGFLQQFRGRDHDAVRSLSARCIGETTAKAAREAGFKKVSIR